MQNELEQKIRERAYELWEQDGRVPGRAEEHWQTAERELTGSGVADRPSQRQQPVAAGTPIEALAPTATAKKATRSRRAAPAEAEAPAPAVAPKRRRSAAARVTSH